MPVRTRRTAPGRRAFRSAWWSAPRARRGRPLALLAAGLLLALLAACGGDGPTEIAPAASPPPAARARSSATPSPAPVTPTPAFSSGTVAADAIVWASALDPTTGAPLERSPVFPPDAPHIYAAVPLRHVEAGTQMRIDWRYNDTPMDSLASEAVARQTADDLWIAFALSLGDGRTWPVGVYEAIVSIDGREALRSVAHVEPPVGD